MQSYDFFRKTNVCNRVRNAPLWETGLENFCNESSPAGLMGSADSPSGVAMKIFMEQNVILKVRISLNFGVVAEYRPQTVFIFQKYFG
jgi:hypothetical protein